MQNGKLNWDGYKSMPKIRTLRRGLLLAVVAVVIAATAAIVVSKPASPEGQAVSPEPERAPADVIAFPVSLSPGHEGIALIDKTYYTLSIYQYQPNRAAHERLVLLATRSFRYDRQLESYNTASPSPEEIKALLERFHPADSGEPTPAGGTGGNTTSP